MRQPTSSPTTDAHLPIAARRHPLVTELSRALRDRCGPIPPGPLVVGVSGGPDSVALLGGLLVLRGRDDGPGVEPVAIHVHHHLRPSADDDAAHVSSLCGRLGVPVTLRHVYPSGADEARRMRYGALVEEARRVGATCIATAHHADDQLETVLMGLCQGGGLERLAGMPSRRVLDDEVELVRPLLGVRKSDCVAFCGAAKLTYCDDPTNADASQMRARLRQNVVPVLEALWPRAVERAAESADAVAAARELERQVVERVFGAASERTWARDDLRPWPAPVIAAGLRRAVIDELGFERRGPARRQLLEAAQLIRGDDRSPKRFDWSHGLKLEVRSKAVTLAG